MTPLDAIRVIAGAVQEGFDALPLLDDDNLSEAYVGAEELAQIPATGAVRLTVDPGQERVIASEGLYLAPVVATLEIYRPKGQGQGQAWRDAQAIAALFRGRQFLAPAGGTGHLVCERTHPERIGADPERDLYRIDLHLIFHNYSNHP